MSIDHQNHAADRRDLLPDLGLQFGNVERAGNKMHVDSVGVEVQMLCHRDPAHADVVGVFSGEIQHRARRDFTAREVLAARDRRRQRQARRGLAVAGPGRE